MAKDRNSFSKISRAPPPPTETPLRRGSYVPHANTEPARPLAETKEAFSQAKFSIFQAAVRHCRAAIFKARNAKAVDQERWAYEAKHWSEVLRPQLEEALTKCEQAGIPADELAEAHTQTKYLDAEWRLIREYRDGVLTKGATPRPSALVASEVEDCFATARDWITALAKRMKTAGEIRADVRQTAFSKELAARMFKANEAYQHSADDAHKDKISKTGMSMPRPVGFRHISNNLRKWGLWPISDIE